MRDVPKAVDAAFYAGDRTRELPFVHNDYVEIVEGAYAGRRGVVISIESLRPNVNVLVECDDGGDTIVPVSALRRREPTV